LDFGFLKSLNKFLGVLDPRESAQWIVENTNPHLITIDTMAVQRVAKMVILLPMEEMAIESNFTDLPLNARANQAIGIFGM
jgi:hypothetical protein